MGCIGCPKCRGRLEKVIYREIEIDRCRDCAGIWFDSLEADRLKNIRGSESVDIGNERTTGECEAGKNAANCPKCRKKMLKMLDFDKHALWYEKCPRCQGMWLSAGQFTRYKQNFTATGAIGRAKKLLHLSS